MLTQPWREDILELIDLPQTANTDTAEESTGKASGVEEVLGIKPMSMASVKCDKATTPSRREQSRANPSRSKSHFRISRVDHLS